MPKSKKDYIALQNLWYECAIAYLHSINYPELRVRIIDDWVNSLVNIEEDGEKAIKKNYKEWEEKEWYPMCQLKLMEWIDNNPFEAKVDKNKDNEFYFIQQDFNYLRYEKIMQVIQDSGIGLGQISSSGGGYYVGPKDVDRFTK